MVRGLTSTDRQPNIIAVSTCSVFNEGNASCKTDGYRSKNIKLGKWDLLSNDCVSDGGKKEKTKHIITSQTSTGDLRRGVPSLWTVLRIKNVSYK